MRFRSRNNEEGPPPPNTIIGVGSSLHGTLMVTGTLRIDGEFEGDVLNCERIEIGEHGVLRADVEVREAWIAGRVVGNIRANGSVLMKSGAQVEGDVAAASVEIEPGVQFNGRCTMTALGAEPFALAASMGRGGDR